MLLDAKVKLGESNLISISIVVGVVLSLTMPTKSQTTAAELNLDEFPVPVGSSHRDFIVKFKGEIFSWKNLSRLLRQHNITVPQNLLDAVLEQKTFRHHSCQGRCFLNERKYDRTCFCDEACKTFSDCCLDFHTRCSQTGNGVSLQKVTCGNVNIHSWSGVLMKNSCSLHNQSTNDCRTVRQLNMTLQKELPVFYRADNVTYRSFSCARCNNEENFSFWFLHISCAFYSIGSVVDTPVNITGAKSFLKEHPDCSWKYAPRDRNQRENLRSCVLPDTQCAWNQLPVLSVVRELCSLYSMVFSVNNKLTYRNPHCALCNPGGRLLEEGWGIPGSIPPLTILLDVSANIPDPIKEPENPPPTLIAGPTVHNLTNQVLNCSANCTVTSGRYTCENYTSTKNQSTLARLFSLNESHSIMVISQKQFVYHKSDLAQQGNTVYIVCLEYQAGLGRNGGQVDKDPSWHNSTVLIYITFTGTLLSIISLCFLLTIYLSFKELRNLPGKCLINLCLALLCYQGIFLVAAKSKEVDTLCKAVAIFLHFFLFAAFLWMSIMAFDTASTFTVQVRVVRRQPSDIRKTFIKYCIVGWGLPAVVVGLCSVLDFTEALPIGYGNSTYCWLSDRTAIAVFMVTPASLALVFNVMCLTKNIYAIRHQQQDARQALNNSSRPSLTLICIKLTTVMGLAWILELLANWKQTAFLQYPSTVLNSMQGFFIALCFITTKKARGLLKNGFFKRWNGAVEP